MTSQIREYWEQRAAENRQSPTATTSDIHLRRLEIRTLLATIRGLGAAPATLLDAGCGDGYSTVEVARGLPGTRVLGVDYAEAMVESARARLADDADLASRVAFRVGDVGALGASCGDERFDVVTTDRVLINLDSEEAQARAIGEIARHVRPGGHYVAIENFLEGQEGMNAARAAVGLPPIPVRWHNRFFTEPQFRAAAAPYFDVVRFEEFSSAYYYATRVIYSAMCRMRGEEPDYDHEIHRLAVDLPPVGQFSPIRLAVLRRAAE